MEINSQQIVQPQVKTSPSPLKPQLKGLHLQEKKTESGEGGVQTVDNVRGKEPGESNPAK